MNIALRRPVHQGNKGDDLMVLAALEQLHHHNVDVVTAIQHSRYDAIIDCCGYAYTDEWGPANALRLSSELLEYSSPHTKVMLLPQTLGPFQCVKTQEAMKSIIEKAHCVYARDNVSLRHAQHLHPTYAHHVHYAPDITVLINGTQSLHLPGNIAIIPNVHMYRLPAGKSAYITLLQRVYSSLLVRGHTPFLMTHDHIDDAFIAEFSAMFMPNIPILFEEDALAMKGVVSQCSAVISSRFHGILNAVSQGVPTLGTAWNYKFNALFAEYNCSECLLSPTASINTIEQALDAILTPSLSFCLRQKITTAQQNNVQLSQRMWSHIHTLLL